MCSIPSETETVSALAVELVLVDRPHGSFHVLNTHKELV